MVNTKKEHNQGRKYGNEPLPQEHNLVFPTVLSFQLLAETRVCALQRQVKDRTPDFTSSPATTLVEQQQGPWTSTNVP